MSLRLKGRWMRRILVTLAAEPWLTLRQLTIRCGVVTIADRSKFHTILGSLCQGQHVQFKRDGTRHGYAVAAHMQPAATLEYRRLFRGETI